MIAESSKAEPHREALHQPGALSPDQEEQATLEEEHRYKMHGKFIT